MQTEPNGETWQPQTPAPAPDTPPYYATPDGRDLYALLQEHYGTEAFAKHLEMEVLQYLWRCRSKGQYDSDLKKVIVILQRLLTLKQETPDSL